jgi:hypothetical protein
MNWLPIAPANVSTFLRSKTWTFRGREAFVNPFVRIRALLVSIAVLFLVATVSADTLILRDGRRIQGQLISFQNGMVEFQQAGFGGRSGWVHRDEVMAIELGRDERGESPEKLQGARPRGLREKQIIVVANASWTDTGIDLTAGQNIYMEAIGEIRWGPNRRANPTGELNSPYNSARPLPNRPGAALIGRIAASGDPFFVGDDRGAFRIHSSGRLLLGINDDYLQDNSGYFRVIVYY